MKDEDTEDELPHNTTPHQWLQPDDNSVFIKLEANSEKKDPNLSGKGQKEL